MRRAAVLIYGLLCYLMFLGTLLYAMGFVTGVLVPKAINDGVVTARAPAIVVNLLLLSVFAVQHSVMARPWFKRRWTRVVPQPLERSTYVFLTNLALILLFWQWRPLPRTVWEVEASVGQALLWGLCAAGWLLVLVSSFLIDHFDLFGIRQVVSYYRDQPYEPPQFRLTAFYKYVRHPLLLGFLIAFWSTPQMTVGHLLFATVTTAYVLIAIPLEERDLMQAHGEDYQEYRRRVPMLLPLPQRERK